MKYDTALTCFRRLAKLCGLGEKFTLHIPMAVLPTWAPHLGWHKEGRAALGMRTSNSEIPNWYVRAVCNAELRLRNEIIQKIPTRKPAGAFDLPKKRQSAQNEDDLSRVDSTSVATSSEEEVNIADLGDTSILVSGYAPSV